jgi:hypothetical protein
MCLDALNFTLAIDSVIENGLTNLAPHMSAFDLDNPREISEAMAMPKPVVATIASFLDEDHQQVDPHKYELMKQLALA